MKTILCLCALIVSAWSQTPLQPNISATCFFHYNATEIGDPASHPILAGYFGATFDEQNNGLMQVFNQTETTNGNRLVRHDFSLDIMETGVEYYMNWTAGAPKNCDHYENEAEVENLWEDQDQYKFNGTQTLKTGKEMNVWKLDIGQGQSILLGVSVDDNTLPLMYGQVIKQRGGVVRTIYMITKFTDKPKESYFAVPPVCRTQSNDNTSGVTRKRRSTNPLLQRF